MNAVADHEGPLSCRDRRWTFQARYVAAAPRVRLTDHCVTMSFEERLDMRFERVEVVLSPSDLYSATEQVRGSLEGHETTASRGAR